MHKNPIPSSPIPARYSGDVTSLPTEPAAATSPAPATGPGARRAAIAWSTDPTPVVSATPKAKISPRITRAVS
jgi:hypothetical protein